MKKFYLAVALSLSGLFLFVNSSYAQPPYTPAETYETQLSGGSLSDPTIWINGNIPSALNPCDHCKFILHGTINVDVVVNLRFGSLIVLSNDAGVGTIVNQNKRVTLENTTEVEVLSNSTLFVNDELDLVTGSFVTIFDGTGVVDANNQAGNVPVSPPSFIAAGPFGPGIYAITNPAAYPAFGSYQVALGQLGFGDPTNPADVPPCCDPGSAPAGTRFFTRYIINCTLPAFPPATACIPGRIFGPATLQPTLTLDPTSLVPIIAFMSGTPLPVTLVQFVAQDNGDGTNKISWATSQEENASHFDVERSGDLNTWVKIGVVQAKGFSSITTNYSYIDQQPIATTSYYRLKMVDQDGKFEYSKVATVSSDTKGQQLVIYNNPFTDMIRIKVNTNSVDNLSLTVTDMVGKTYFTEIYKARSGDNYININPNAATGLYILHVQGRGLDRTVKLVKE
jgi:hypothetical protein